MSEIMPGDRFGRLTAVRAAVPLEWKGGRPSTVVRCDCGTEKVVRNRNLLSGRTVSCGCYLREVMSQLNRKHGLTNHPIYRSWNNMMSRCHCAATDRFSRYGGRGITVCERWYDPANFIADMEPTWAPGLTLDRIDNDAGYSPENCRWTDRKTQQRNRHNNRLIDTPLGKMCVADAADTFGITGDALRKRLRLGWPESRLFAPVRAREPAA